MQLALQLTESVNKVAAVMAGSLEVCGRLLRKSQIQSMRMIALIALIFASFRIVLFLFLLPHCLAMCRWMMLVQEYRDILIADTFVDLTRLKLRAQQVRPI